MKTLNNDSIQDYILENEDNLRIALAVSNAWAEAGEKLVFGFLDRLRSRLEETLKGWEFNPLECYLNDSDASFNFWKPAWKEEYYVSLEIWRHGQEGSFGLGRDGGQENIRKRKYCDGLLAAVRKHFPEASNRKWWEAEMTMQSPAADWSKPEVLWQMHDDPKFLVDVAVQLLKVAKISEPIVDRFVDELPRK